MTVRTVLSTLSISFALLGACSEIHSPQAGDTNTSWLQRCESESDCGPGARCIAQLCTLPCEEASANSCTQISKAATCDLESQACDVSCSADQDCHALGADLRCEASHCRPLPELSLSEETLTLASAEDLGVSLPLVFDTQAIWLDGHFRIGTTLGERVPVSKVGTFTPFECDPCMPMDISGWQSWTSAFMVSDVFPDGRVEHRLLRGDSQLSSALKFKLGQNGGVARIESENDPSTIDAQNPRGSSPATRCAQTFYDSDLAIVSTGTHACDEWLQPVTTDTNGDWLMWASREADGLGRYRPSEQRWVEEPQRLAIKERFGVGSTQVRDDRLWLHAQSEWGSSMLADIPLTGSLSALSVPETWQSFPVEFRLLRPLSMQAGWEILRYRDGWLIRDDRMMTSQQTEPDVRALPIGPGQSQEPVSFALDAAGKIGFGTLQQIPGRDLVAICYVDFTEQDRPHFELKLSWFDTRGAALGGPLQLASTSEHNVTQCELTWSGRDLLATWVAGGPIDPRGASYSRRVRVR